MKSACTVLASLALLPLSAAAQVALEGPYAPERWADTGIDEGTTSIGKAVELFYAVNDPDTSDGVPFRTAEYSTIASADGTIDIAYDARFRHAFFSQEFFLQAFVDTDSGRQTVTLVDVRDPGSPDEPRDYNGSVTLTVEDGDTYGFIVGGGNFDSNPRINGNLAIWDLRSGSTSMQEDAELWTAGPILEGTTGARTALRFDYDVDLGFGGVSFRTADVTAFATEDGTAEFNWSWSGFHSFFLSVGQLGIVADAGDGPTYQPLVDEDVPATFVYSGRNSAEVSSSNEFGIRVGGGNGDSNARIRGTVILWRFGVEEAQPCLADLNDDGLLDLSDINLFISTFTGATCP